MPLLRRDGEGDPVSEQQTKEDLCDCFGDLPKDWPPCVKFKDNDKGVCIECSHSEECHDNR